MGSRSFNPSQKKCRWRNVRGFRSVPETNSLNKGVPKVELRRRGEKWSGIAGAIFRNGNPQASFGFLEYFPKGTGSRSQEQQEEINRKGADDLFCSKGR